MKTSKSPQKTEVTPSKKKLKQARLPFKLISDVSPKLIVPQNRKRKLSTPETEPVTKVGKISKENDLIEDSVIISDDDSKGSEIPSQVDISMNPYVKLVDTAWKKKLQKSKKKKTGKKKSIHTSKNGLVDVESGTDSADNKEQDNEMMDVDEAPNTEVNHPITNSEHVEPKKTTLESMKSSLNEKNNETNEIEADKVNLVVLLEDSNDPDHIKFTETDNTENEITTDNEEDEKDAKDQNSSDINVSTKEEVMPRNASKKSLSKSTDSTETSENQITPKRSARNKSKVEQNNNSKGSPNSKLNGSTCSNPTTPKQTPKTSRSSSVTNSQGDVSLNESIPSVNLTPKQVQKKLESEKKREEREKEKQERDKKKQQEKEDRAKMRSEKEDQRKREREEKEEAKRKEKEEKEEQKRKEKEEKERQKDLEKKQREEKEEQKRKEKEEKEEQRRKEKEAKEEEKRKKQEALELERQEQELKKKKAAEAFVNFFVPKQKSEIDEATIACISKTSMLSNFMIKNDMRLAPLVRVDLSADKKDDLVHLIENQTVPENGLYLKCLKDGKSKPLTSGKTWPLSDKDDDNDDDDDVMVVEDELPSIDGAGEILTCETTLQEKLRPKLLSFHENRRPPYWGTWRKKSASVRPRQPFGQDEKQVDYEADSDEEWEEEQEGESIDGSAAGSDDEQDADEYEVDNVVFVPHGYLSDEEATMDEDDVLSLSPETQKQRLKHLEDEFESEMKKPTEKLKPRMYGLLWETADGGKPEKCVDALWNYFGKLAMIMNDPTPFLQPASEPEETEKKKVKKKKLQKETTDGEPKQKSPKTDKKKKSKTEETEIKTSKSETKKNIPENKKTQPGINMFLTKKTS